MESTAPRSGRRRSRAGPRPGSRGAHRAACAPRCRSPGRAAAARRDVSGCGSDRDRDGHPGAVASNLVELGLPADDVAAAEQREGFASTARSFSAVTASRGSCRSSSRGRPRIVPSLSLTWIQRPSPSTKARPTIAASSISRRRSSLAAISSVCRFALSAVSRTCRTTSVIATAATRSTIARSSAGAMSPGSPPPTTDGMRMPIAARKAVASDSTRLSCSAVSKITVR